jgi:hypothetical protein
MLRLRRNCGRSGPAGELAGGVANYLIMASSRDSCR